MRLQMSFLLSAVGLIATFCAALEDEAFSDEHIMYLKRQEQDLLGLIRRRFGMLDDFVSRARRTSDTSVRLCGKRVWKAVTSVCPEGCKSTRKRSVQKRSEVGIATKCCDSMCSYDDIKAFCCP